MNHNRRNFWMIVAFALVVVSVACAPVYTTAPSASNSDRPADIALPVSDRGAGSQSASAPSSSCPPANPIAGKDVGRDYFVQVVGRLKDVPASDFAANALEAWKPYENTLASWNPLATTWKMDAVCNFNSVGVQNYQNQDMGTQATANTLNLGYYDAIRKMLRKEAFDREGMRAALGTWGTCSGQGCDSLLDKWQSLWQ